jgi:F0F1-type ATP synthase membrane subunit b/b'
VSPAAADFLFEAANLLLLAAALGWLLFRPVRAALDAERDRHARAQAESAERRAEAERLSAEARAVRVAADQDAEERRRALLAAARQEAARLLDEARRVQAAERRAEAEERDAVTRRQAVALAGAVGEIAADALRRLLETLDGPALDLALVRAACAELGAVPAAARATARVESARPLGAEALRLLAGLLGEGFQAGTVPELGAGVRVTTSAGQVDASALALARQAAREVAGLATPIAGALEGAEARGG